MAGKSPRENQMYGCMILDRSAGYLTDSGCSLTSSTFRAKWEKTYLSLVAWEGSRTRRSCSHSSCDRLDVSISYFCHASPAAVACGSQNPVTAATSHSFSSASDEFAFNVVCFPSETCITDLLKMHKKIWTGNVLSCVGTVQSPPGHRPVWGRSKFSYCSSVRSWAMNVMHHPITNTAELQLTENLLSLLTLVSYANTEG